ncbi:DUF4397 domain-containing protein [Actinokineospora sp.]|uniref:DUF4397 domain-containing protein n=1 Tax=Actinokineospora sp. TaxID=1872133 RepID=UPI0040382815
MRSLRRIGAAVAALALVTLVSPAPAAAQPAPGADLGWVRLGHLSPEVPPVDVYLAPFGGRERVIIRKAGYGAVTPYSTLVPGAYTVSMRPADAASTAPPALSATVQIVKGSAYSLLVFATGPQGALRGDLVIDDLSAPRPGSGRLRIVQGAARLAPVTADVGGGPALATSAAYGMTTPYTDLTEGRYTLRLRGEQAETPAAVDVRAGTSTTLLVTEAEGALVVNPLVDSTATATAPRLGVETGAGGTAPAGAGWLLLIPAALLAAFATGSRHAP